MYFIIYNAEHILSAKCLVHLFGDGNERLNGRGERYEKGLPSWHSGETAALRAHGVGGCQAPEVRSSNPGPVACWFTQVNEVHIQRVISRASTEGSTVSSLICDRWLMQGLETLSISLYCLSFWHLANKRVH